MRMSWLVRTILTLLLTASLFGTAVGEASAGLAAEIAAAANPCCESDCPDIPACGAACAMTRGGAPVFSLPQAQALVLAALETDATLSMIDQHLASGPPPDGVRRPPRV